MNAKSASRSLHVLLAALLLAAVAPAHAKDFLCGFQATGLALNFGTIDPSNAVQVVTAVQAVNMNANNVGDCNGGATLDISVVGATSRALSNGTDTIPYTITGFPITMSQPGNNKYVNFLSPAMTGTIAAGTYANASAGTYTDTVTISVSP
jgi:spore coat protein U-like protein